MRWLEDEFPELVPRYEATYAKNAYGPVADRKRTTGTVHDLVHEAGGLRLKPGIQPRFSHRRRDDPDQVEPAGEQLAFPGA